MRVLTIDTLIVKLRGRSLYLAEDLEHIIRRDFARPYQGKKESLVSNVGPVQPKLNHQALARRQLTLLTKLEVHEHVVTQHLLNDLQVRVWVICVRLRTVSLVEVVAHLRALFFLLRTLLEKDLPQNVFLLFVAVIVLDIVVMRLVEHGVIVVVAVRVLVPYSSGLSSTQRLGIGIGINAHRKSLVVLLALVGTASVVLILVRARNQKDSLVKPTNHRNLGLLLLLLLLS